MRSKIPSLHPLLIILAVALASVLFVAACGGGAEPTAAPVDAQAAIAAAEAAAAKATELAAAAEAAGEADAAQAAAEAAAAAEDAAMIAADAIAAADAQAAVAAAELAALAEKYAKAEAGLADAEAQVAAAAAKVAAEGQPQYGGTLRVTMGPTIGTLDPLLALGTVQISVHQATYDNLLMIQPDLSVKPELATSWEPNDDFTSFTFNLRQGVKFHHGKDFKAEDVAFTVNRWIDPVIDSSIRPTFKVIEEMVILDDYTIRFDLDAPNSFFPTYFSIFQARILPADVDIDRMALEEFGSGPFKILEHLQGERTTMVRNDDYWEEGKPYLDELVVLSIPEQATRDAALKAGDVDLVHKLSAQSAPGLYSHPDTTVLNASTFTFITLSLPTVTPPFDNLLVRKAMQAATDRESINQAALLGLGTIASDHPIHPGHPAFAPQYAPPDYDIELARSLLEQAGYPDGIDVTLYTADVGAGMIEMAIAFAESAAPAGIRVDVQKVPSDGFWGEYWNNDLFTVAYWVGRIPDQALTVQSLSDAAWNTPRFKSARLDELVLKARGQDLAGRKESYGEVQKILIDNVPRIIPAFQPWLYGVRNNVRGAPPHPLGWPFYQDAWFAPD